MFSGYLCLRKKCVLWTETFKSDKKKKKLKQNNNKTEEISEGANPFSEHDVKKKEKELHSNRFDSAAAVNKKFLSWKVTFFLIQ